MNWEIEIVYLYVCTGCKMAAMLASVKAWKVGISAWDKDFGSQDLIALLRNDHFTCKFSDNVCMGTANSFWK